MGRQMHPCSSTWRQKRTAALILERIADGLPLLALTTMVTSVFITVHTACQGPLATPVGVFPHGPEDGIAP